MRRRVHWWGGGACLFWNVQTDTRSSQFFTVRARGDAFTRERLRDEEEAGCTCRSSPIMFGMGQWEVGIPSFIGVDDGDKQPVRYRFAAGFCR